MKTFQQAAMLLLMVILLALLLLQSPVSVYSQEADIPATATALSAMQQSIFATQTAVALSTAAPTSTPQPRAQTPTQQPTAANAAPVAEVLVQGLNLRNGPGTGYAIIGNAALGQRLPVLGQWGGCAWLKVQLANGGTAWTSGANIYSRLNVPCSRVALAAAPTLVAPTAPPAPVAAATARPQPTSQPTARTNAAPANVAAANVSVPILVAPENGADHRFSRITFMWRWDGELQPGWGFAILAWVGSQPHRAMMDARQTAGMRPNGQGLYSLDVGVPEAFSQASMNWTVAVVQLDPYTQISGEAAPYLLHVDTRLPTPRPDEDDGADGKNPDDE